MSWWNRKREQKAAPPVGLTDEAAWLVFGGGGPTAAGVTIGPGAALTVPAVRGAIALIAESCASVAWTIHHRVGDQREVATDHPLSKLIRDGANSFTSWPEFVAGVVSDALRYGRGYALATRGADGRLLELLRLPAGTVSRVAADSVRRSMSGLGQGGYAAERGILDGQIAAAKREIDDLEESGKATGYRPEGTIAAARAKLDELTASSEALDRTNQAAAAAWKKAEESAKAAAADKQWKDTKAAIDGVNSSLESVATKGEKVAKIHEDAAKTVAGLKRDLAVATTDEQRSAIEAAIRTAGEVEKRKIAALDTGGGARSQGRGLDGFESAIVSQQARTAKMVEEAKLLGDNTHALDAYRVKLDLEAAAKRSGIPISDEMVARIAKEAENYRAAAVEVDAYKEKIKTADEARSDLKGFSSTFVSDMLHGKSAVESLADAVQRLRDKLADRLEDSILDAILGKSGTPNSGLSGLWGMFSSSSGGVSGQPGSFNLFGLLGKFFGFFAEGGNIPSGGWGIAGEAGPEIIHGPATVVPWGDIVGKAPAVSTATAGGFSRLVDPKVVVALARASGAAPDKSARRAVSVATLATAPRFHSGLLSGELPAILLKGESVLNTGLTDRIGGTMSGLADMAANSNYTGGTYAPTINMQMMGSSGNATADRQHAAMVKRELRSVLDAHFAESVSRQLQPGGVLAGAAAGLKA